MRMKIHWWHKSCVYQIYPMSFNDSNGDGIGDIAGITEKIPYLHQLGIEILWISPMYESPNIDNGYDISDYHKFQKVYGTDEEFDRLLKIAHENNIRIVMDLVVNHTSDQHAWFIESRSSRNNPYRDYYIWRDPKDGHAPNNWGSCFSGSAWEFDDATGQYYLHLFAREQPDLNWDNPKVRDGVFQMMKWWIDRGIDGFRMDVISLISKDPAFPDAEPGFNGYAPFNAAANGPHVHEYLQEMNRKVLNNADGRDLITVGECSGATIEEALKYANLSETELSMVFQFDHMALDNNPENGSKWSLQKMNLIALKDTMTIWETALHGKAWNSLFWCNHDQPRIVSRLGNEGRFREKSAKMLATCLHMLEGTPYIYQGEEIGMTNMQYSSETQFRDLDAINGLHEILDKNLMDPKQAWRAVCYKTRDNARHPMQWDDSENAGFTTGQPWIDVNPNYKEINVADALARKDSIFYYYQKLIKLRKEMKLIVYGEYQLLDRENPGVWTYTRQLDNELLLCICNFTDHQAEAPAPWQFSSKEGNGLAEGVEVLIANTDRINIAGGEFKLEPYDAVVLYGLTDSEVRCPDITQ
jgi:oligo-1,6-glucosidase